jgi:WD40 repeat protein
VKSVAVSVDGNKLAAGGRNRVILWELTSGKRIHTLKGPTIISSVAFFPNDTVLAASGEDSKSEGGAVAGVDPRIMLWDVETGKVRTTMPLNEASGVAFSPNGRKLASVKSLGMAVMLWDLPANRKKER